MSTFPPAKGVRSNPPNPVQVTGERGPVSTGNGGLKASLKVKNAAIKNSPVEKTVNQF